MGLEGCADAGASWMPTFFGAACIVRSVIHIAAANAPPPTLLSTASLLLMFFLFHAGALAEAAASWYFWARSSIRFLPGHTAGLDAVQHHEGARHTSPVSAL